MALLQYFWRFARNLQQFNAKLFLLLFLNNFRRKNFQSFSLICCKFLSNLSKSSNSWNNVMSMLENMDLPWSHLAVSLCHWPYLQKFSDQFNLYFYFLEFQVLPFLTHCFDIFYVLSWVISRSFLQHDSDTGN